MARFFAGRGRVKIARGEIADNRLLHGPEHGPEHGALIPETDFDLGWVHVYVHFFRRQIHEQDDLRVFLGKEAPLVGFADGAQDDLVVDGPAVDVEQHPVAARLGLSGRGDQPVDADVIGGAVERQQSFRNGIGPDDREAFLQGLPGGEPQDFPRPGKEDEARVRMRERQTGEEFLRTLLFGRGRFQKFEAGGDGGEEVADFDDRSLVQAARPLLASTPCSIWMKAASGSASSEARKADSMRKLDTDAMLGRASPRNPKDLCARDRPCWLFCWWRGA